MFRRPPDERQPLVRRRSFDEYETGAEESDSVAQMAGGTVLGIHNLAIVMPQFIVRVLNLTLILNHSEFKSGCTGDQCNFQDC